MPNPDSHNSEASSAIRVAIVEGRPDIRDGLALIINGADGYECVGVYGTMESALVEIGKLMAGNSPLEVVLIDIGLPGLSGIEGIKLLRERHPQLSLLALTDGDDDARIFEALCAGVSGYLLKTTPPPRLLESLREVVAGGAPMSPEVARRVVNLVRSFHQPAQAQAQDGHGLTPHEKRVLKLLVEGHNYKTAAAELGISVNTVSFHVQRIYGKLKVHSKSEAVAKALKNNLV
jgi:DNA-binding NarL/FixJ family response regulator